MPEDISELYRVIEAGGADAESFLQGQLTQDVAELVEGSPARAAICNPKGRVLATLWLARTADACLLVVADGIADALMQRLTMYRLRAKVTLEWLDYDWRTLLPATDHDRESLVRHGIPLIDDANSEAFTAHMLNLDKLGAISFTKGCYTGQEVIARTENLGKSKRRMMRYQAAAEGPGVGDKLQLDERNVGEIVNVAGKELLAVTPVESHLQTLAADGIAIEPQGLPYDI